MKHIILWILSILIFPNIGIAQNFLLELKTGGKFSQHSQSSIYIRPDKIKYTTTGLGSLHIGYMFPKTPISIHLGAGYSPIVRSFRISGVPLFTRGEGFPPIRIIHQSIFIPLEAKMRWVNKKKWATGSSMGITCFWIDPAFPSIKNGTAYTLYNGIAYNMDYTISQTSYKEYGWSISAGTWLEIKLNERLSINTEFKYNLGLTSNITSFYDYTFTLNSLEGTGYNSFTQVYENNSLEFSLGLFLKL